MLEIRKKLNGRVKKVNNLQEAWKLCKNILLGSPDKCVPDIKKTSCLGEEEKNPA
jgi:hypothetical protein